MASTKKITFDEFVTRARKVHGDKYRYDESTFINMRTKMRIYCTEKDENGKEHGWFEQQPHHHLNGHGCRKCASEENRKRFSMTTEECVNRFKKIWGDKFDYQYVNYRNIGTKVKIWCYIHGIFEQTPYDHLDGHGCPYCYNDRRSQIQSMSKEEFIRRAKEVHGDRYDYSLVVYVNAFTEVWIICPKHGPFKQKPYSHLQGHGCKRCNNSRLETNIELFLKENKIYYIHIADKDHLNWLGRLTLDFYLPDYRTAIECQGEQHFEPVKKWGGEELLNKIIERDTRKAKLCKENNVKLLYYGEKPHDVENLYLDKNKLLEKILNG